MNKIALFLDRKVIERSRFKTFVQLVSREILLGYYLVKSNRVKPILREVIAGNVSRDCERERKEKKEKRKEKGEKSFEDACRSKYGKSQSTIDFDPFAHYYIHIYICPRSFPRVSLTRLYLAVLHDKQIERICWK